MRYGWDSEKGGGVAYEKRSLTNQEKKKKKKKRNARDPALGLHGQKNVTFRRP
jgi:hypothetical protein